MTQMAGIFGGKEGILAGKKQWRKSMELLDKTLEKNRRMLDELLGVGKNYDIITRDLVLGSRKGRIYMIDGYGDDGVLERILSFLLGAEKFALDNVQDMQALVDQYITFGEVDVENRTEQILTGAFLGKTVRLVDGFDQ